MKRIMLFILYSTARLNSSIQRFLAELMQVINFNPQGTPVFLYLVHSPKFRLIKQAIYHTTALYSRAYRKQ